MRDERARRRGTSVRADVRARKTLLLAAISLVTVGCNAVLGIDPGKPLQETEQAACEPDSHPPDEVMEAPGKRGMTWTQYYVLQGEEPVPYDSCGQLRVGCNDCDAYAGDTLCSEERPILCIEIDGSSNACAALEPAIPGDGWAGGTLAVTPQHVRGTDLTARAVADRICADTFGPGYRMAEHHDGGGWAFRANGTIDPFCTPSSTHPRLGTPNQRNRFWVGIGDQPANCWD